MAASTTTETPVTSADNDGAFSNPPPTPTAGDTEDSSFPFPYGFGMYHREDDLDRPYDTALVIPEYNVDTATVEGACDMMAITFEQLSFYYEDAGLAAEKAFYGIPWLNALHEDPEEWESPDLQDIMLNLPTREYPRMEAILGVEIDSVEFYNLDYDCLAAAMHEFLGMLEQDDELIDDDVESGDEEGKTKKNSPIDEDAKAANNSQRQRALAKQFNHIMKSKDPKGHVTFFDQIFLKGSLGITYDAYYYNYNQGSPLYAPSIKGQIGISIEVHQPNFCLFVSDEKEVEALRRATKDGVVPHPDSEAPESGREKREWRQILDHAKARATTVKARIGFAALIGHNYVPIENYDQFVLSNKALAAHFSNEMNARIHEILSKGGIAIFYSVKFDVELVAQDKIFLGTPSWATDFTQAIKDGFICCIIDGSRETTRRIQFIGETMDDQKAFGSRVNQMWMDSLNSRRLVLHPNRIRTTPNSESITKETYKYHPDMPNYSFEEGAIKMGVSIQQDLEALQDKKTVFEDQTHDISFIRIAGTHGGHLLGFIDWPFDDATLLTEGTMLRLTFPEDEKKDTPEKEEGKHNAADSGSEEKATGETTPTSTSSETAPAPASAETTTVPASSETTPAPTAPETTPASTSSETAPAPTSAGTTANHWESADAFSDEPYVPSASMPSPNFSWATAAPPISEALPAPTSAETTMAPTSAETTTAPTSSETPPAPTSSETATTPTSNDAPTAGSSETTATTPGFVRTVGLLPAQEEYDADFPNGAGLLYTPAIGLRCGLYALIRSVQKQDPSVEPPTIEELDDVLVGPMYLSDMPVNNTDMFSADQLNKILDIWYNDKHRRRPQLFILQDIDGALEPVKIHTTHLNGPVIWIHHAGNHWSGLESLTADEYEADQAAQDDDADAKYLVEKREKKDAERSASLKCRVSPPLPNGPANKIPVIITIPWDKEKQQFVCRPLPIIDTSYAAEYDFKKLIQGAPTIRAKLKVIDSTSQSKRNLRALEMLNYAPKDKPFTSHNETARKLIACNQLHTLELRDVFRSIRPEFPHPETLMVLNKEQKVIVLAAAEALGGVVLLNGVPGAGKTHMACQFLKPFLMSAELKPILMVAGKNTAADNLLRGAVPTYRKLVAEGKAPGGRRIFRYYSKAPEKAIRSRGIKALLEKDPNARPEVVEVNLREVSNMDAAARLYFDKTRKSSEGLLSETGLVRDEYTPDTAEDEHEDFRKQFKQFYGTKDMTDVQRKEFSTKENQILVDVAKKAAAIVCTLYTAGSKLITDSIAPDLEGIIVDEAYNEMTANLLPLLALRAPKLTFLIFMGDDQQVGPPVLLGPDILTFGPEYYLPLPSRLGKCGFPVSRLYEQGRMVPEIAHITNRLAYEGKMTNALDRCGLRVREAARAFRKWVSSNFSAKPANVVFLDISGKLADTSKHGNSKINTYHAITALNLAPKLLKIDQTSTVCLMATHAPQRNLLLSGLASMELDSSMKPANLARLSVGTVDSLIGKEYNFVVLSLLVDDSAGFLSDVRRLVVALTRARDGLIVLLSGRAVNRLEVKGGTYLKDLVEELKRFRIEQNAGNFYPTCRWITPEVSAISSWQTVETLMTATAAGGQDDGWGKGNSGDTWNDTAAGESAGGQDNGSWENVNSGGQDSGWANENSGGQDNGWENGNSGDTWANDAADGNTGDAWGSDDTTTGVQADDATDNAAFANPTGDEFNPDFDDAPAPSVDEASDEEASVDNASIYNATVDDATDDDAVTIG